MTSRRGISRREALRDIGVVATSAAAPGLAACGDDDGSSGQPPQGPVGITHIVVVMMENRTYDHYFGARSMIEGLPGDGLAATMSNLDLAGVSQSVYRESVFCVPDPPHGWDASHEQNGAGMNDGFLKAYQEDHGTGVPPHVMGYFARDDLPVLYSLADAYTICDRWFASVMGPTWPNRFYLHSAQSGGYKTNDFPSQAWPTIYDRLDAAGVDWMYYYSDLPFLLTLGNSRNQRVDAFFEEAKAGQLRPVTVIDPSFGLNDDHPPHHPLLGQQFIASIYHALATSPHWNNCLLVVTYDEHGGFFDHVAPPKAADDRASEGFDQLGFRVPALLAGPYVKKGHVSSTVYDHASVLKHIETMFGLEPLTARDAAANDFSDAIDQARLAAGKPAPPVELPAVVFDESMLDVVCTTARKKTDLELAADRGIIPPHLDFRRHDRDLAYFIADYLAGHGKGGVRRGR